VSRSQQKATEAGVAEEALGLPFAGKCDYAELPLLKT
jgi:hypothetical protein